MLSLHGSSLLLLLFAVSVRLCFVQVVGVAAARSVGAVAAGGVVVVVAGAVAVSAARDQSFFAGVQLCQFCVVWLR